VRGGQARRKGPADLAREFVHPVSGPITLGANVGMYAWHGRHHLAHVQLVARGGPGDRLACRPAG